MQLKGPKDRQNRIWYMLKKQFYNIEDPLKWKQTEQWPKNKITSMLDNSINGKTKLYFECNYPSENLLDTSDRKVQIFTDLKSQYHISYYKNAALFWEGNKRRATFHILKKFAIHRRNYIKSLLEKNNYEYENDLLLCRNHHKLPTKILTIMEKDSYGKLFLEKDYINFYVNLDNIGSNAYSKVIDDLTKGLMEKTDTHIYLQELLNSKLEVLVREGLIDKINQDQLDFRKKWLSLHSPELLNKIGINTD